MIMNAEDARISPFPKGTENAKTGETPTLDLQGPRATSWKKRATEKYRAESSRKATCQKIESTHSIIQQTLTNFLLRLRHHEVLGAQAG